MFGNDWRLLKVAENGLEQPGKVGNDWKLLKWLEMSEDGDGWKCLEMARN